MAVDRLSATFAALADPTRRAILERLAAGETSVAELAKPFDISPPAVTKHLKVLQRAGLITQGRQAQWRPCRLNAEPLRDVSDWVEPYHRFWDEKFREVIELKNKDHKLFTSSMQGDDGQWVTMMTSHSQRKK